jgi:subtilisin-like proprotein convertase family protein
MKKLLLLLACLPIGVFAQSFSSTTETPITGSDVLIPIQVSGLANQINGSFGLASVCLDISHQFVEDLQLRLQSPDGKIIDLSVGHGGNGQGYRNTCFMMNGTGGRIQYAPAPFTGSYLPEMSLNVFNDGSDPNGTWLLRIRDIFPTADTGTFHFASVFFMMNPPADPTVNGGPCNTSDATGCACPDGVSTDCDLLPDMTSSVLCIQQDHQEHQGNITMGNATPNIGWGPMEIHGTGSCYCDSVVSNCSTPCPDGSYPKELVIQRIYHKDGNNMSYFDRPAGTMSYHPTHGHVHVDNWADFTLRRSTPDPDARNWPIIGTGNKQSFCLVNLGDCDANYGYCVDDQGATLNKSDIPNSDLGSVTGCSRDQGIYVGNLDIYSSGLNGMGIVLPSTTCNGDYYIVSITDPMNNFLESNDQNNWVAVPITLVQQSAGSFPISGYTYTVMANEVDFTASALGTDSLVWRFGDGSSSVTTTNLSIQHTFPGVGTYIVSLYAYNTCGPTVTIDTVQILSTTGIVEPNDLVGFTASPNPSVDVFRVNYTLINPAPVQLELLDMTGRRITELVNGNQPAGKFLQTIDVRERGLSSGIYYLRLQTGARQQTLRLVVF